MSTRSWVDGIQRRALSITKTIDWLPPLVARVSLGVAFASTGWGKVHSLAKVTGFFQDLGIPLPGLNAVVVSYSELICGTLLVLGLASRAATAPLLVSMVVALSTAKADDIHGLADLFGTLELTYAVLLLWVAIAGPGKVSLDALLKHRMMRWFASSEDASLPAT